MIKTGKNIIANFMLVILVLTAAQLIPGKLYAQEQHPAADSLAPGSGNKSTLPDSKNTYTGSKSALTGSKSAFHATSSSYAWKSAPDPNSNFMKSIRQYKLNLTRNLSILGGTNLGSSRPSGNANYMMGANTMDGMASLNPANLRRADIGLRQVRLDIQHFSLGASYNYGMNNLLRETPQNGRNPGLSLHAGFSF
jgi:hypothetical protein